MNRFVAVFRCKPPVALFAAILFLTRHRICWPFEADQPVAAAQLTLNLDVAFQLLEVRTGAGLRPLHRGYTPTGTRVAMRAEIRRVLAECRGTVGVAKRENVQKIQGRLAQAWEEGGTARAALQAFFVKFLDAA